MADLTIHTNKIINNIERLNAFLEERNIQWSLITKMICGNEHVLQKILSADIIKKLHSVGDARLSNLKAIKKINPDLVTIYIKPPAIVNVKNLVKYADISLNSSFTTINKINEAAKVVGKVHKVIVMIELGELREGIVRDNILSFYERIFNLSNVSVIGIGANLGCMYGIEPNYDKLIQLSLYKLLIEEKFGKKLDLISGGSSITLQQVSRKLPKSINHLRIGETAYNGLTLLTGEKFRNLSTSTIEFSAEIIELEKKDNIPDGVISDAGIGHIAEIDRSNLTPSYKAILDFGTIDVNIEDLTPKYNGARFVGITSDMTVYDLGENKKNYKVGDKIQFIPNYMATARLMNSQYISKIVE